MKIILIDEVEGTLLGTLLSENVVYRPDLSHKSDELLLNQLLYCDIDAIVTSRSLPPNMLNAWAEARRSPCCYAKVVLAGDAAEVAQPASGWHARLNAFSTDPSLPASPYVQAFDMLERFSAQQLVGEPSRNHSGSKPGRGHAVLIGAGLVNLITANSLLSNGYELSIVDSGPDPRANAAWTNYGCSRGGDDARMFTLSEMDNYNDKQVSREMNSVFNRPVAELGWNVHWKNTLSVREKSWIKEFESIPVWLANRYNEDIFAFNRESLPLWENWKKLDGDLFESSLLREDILRLYSDPAQFAAAVARQNRIGATKAVLSPDELAATYPGLAGAVGGGHLAGGVMAIGFTINAHKFIHRLLDRLESAGVHFEWNQRAQRLLFDEAGRIKGIRTASKVIDAMHYVISPGVYGDDLLAGTRSQGKIHGVLGAWLRIPNTDPQLQHSMKLARKGHITEDSNITIVKDTDGSDLLVIGSGYGHTGIDPRNIDHAQLHQIYMGLADTAQKYFPKAYDAALAAGNMEDSFKYCVRPWTASSLGVFEMLDTSHGGKCIITGGHNTGGFTQSPAVARAVQDAMEGRSHAMHAAYHPDRTSHYLGTIAPVLSDTREAAEVA